uniref:Uncharacterized protein n=1 Tax=Acrobeloides nanus TaxID=290746 RepID=A0A914E2J8_9BILA
MNFSLFSEVRLSNTSVDMKKRVATKIDLGGQYPKFPTGHYPDRVDFPDWTISRLDNFPTGHFPDWTHSRPDTFPTIIFPTGHYPD